MGPVEGGGLRFARVFTPLALFALAFFVRCLPIQSIFLRERILFADNDAYYHMRRIAYSIEHFPNSLSFDPYINHPDGGWPIWTPVFDWCVAALLRPFRSGNADLEHLAVFVPPLLGAATVVVLYLIARRHFGTATATLAGGLLAVLSAHFWYSQVGFIDHHAAVALVAAATLGAAMTLLARASVADTDRSTMQRSVLATGVAFGTSLLVWPGMLLHVGLVDAALLGFAMTRRDRGRATAFAWNLATLHLVALALVAPLGLSAQWTEWGPFSPVVLSAFQPWLMAVACLWSAGCAAAWRLDGIGRSRARRLQSGLALAVALLAASIWAFPGLSAAAGDPWEWFAGADPFQRGVGESMPLFLHGGQPSLKIAFARLSAFSLLVPVALCVGVVRARRAARPAPILLFLWWTFGLLTATVIQRRFFNSASVGVALLFALALVASHRALLRKLPRARIPVMVALASAALALLLPTLQTYSLGASNLWRALRGARPQLAPQTYERVVVADMADWIRAHTPIPSGWLDASAKPAYGILAAWEIGHILEYRGRRPTVSDNFGNDIGSENYLRALRYFQSDEESASELLEELSVRYIVTQRDTRFLGVEATPASMAVALFLRDGSMASPAAEAGPGGAALTRHRLIYDSRPLPFTTHPTEPRYKVFEFVRGARIVGRAAPGAQVRATLEVRTNRGRRFVYSSTVSAAADGRYVLRLPYSTRGGPSSVRVDSAYVLECGDERQPLRVDESDVKDGTRVEGPSLCVGS